MLGEPEQRAGLRLDTLDDEDNFHDEQAYFGEVKAWRLVNREWLRRTTRGGQAGDGRERSLQPEYAVVPERPR